MSFRRALVWIALLLAGFAWPLVLDSLTVGDLLARRTQAAEEAVRRARATRGQIEIARPRAARFAAEAEAAGRDLAVLRRVLPATADGAAALADLRAAAAPLGIRLLAWREAARQNRDGYRVLPVEATLDGPLDAIVRLADRLQQQRTPATAVAQLTLEPAQPPPRCRAEIEILLFELPDDTPPPAR